ncbi:MAG TPA: hypothetical protein VFV33_06170 [Gemmatimonadaceae bacterium]|nr:hypothetical protein [Gemmatimonadaceae bacterium]
MRRSLALVLSIVVLCPACASMATQGKVARSASTLSAHVAASERRVFTSRFGTPDGRADLSTSTGSVAAWGSVRIVVNDDDTFEYLATIYNPTGATFTSAHLRRQGDGDTGAVLATLFSDLTLRTHYIQLRGTVSVSRNARASTLAEELRENPRAFTITFHTPASPRAAALRGALD